jgi:hypothetical protein
VNHDWKTQDNIRRAGSVRSVCKINIIHTTHQRDEMSYGHCPGSLHVQLRLQPPDCTSRLDLIWHACAYILMMTYLRRTRFHIQSIEVHSVDKLSELTAVIPLHSQTVTLRFIYRYPSSHCFYCSIRKSPHCYSHSFHFFWREIYV